MPRKVNTSEKSEDEKLLIAVLSQWNPLPAVDNHQLGETLGIKPGTAAVRWHRFKAKLFKDNGNKGVGGQMEVKVEQTTATLDGAGEESKPEEKADAVVEKVKKRKQPAEKRPRKKSITTSLNAATSKPGTSKGKTTNEELSGLYKQKYRQIEDGFN